MGLQEVLSVYLYASRRQTPATASPFLLCNAFLRCSPGAKRGPQAPGRRPPAPPAYVGYRERRAIADTINNTLRPMFNEMLEYFKRKDQLHNERIKAMSEPFPVLLTKRQHADLRCKAMREMPGSKYIKRRKERKPNGEETTNQ
jgi:hypothetical protein